jgi:ribonuclease HI
MKVAIDGGKRTVPPVTAWAVVDFDSDRSWSGTLDPNFTSNQAEYYALINAMKIAIAEGETKILLVQSDSELMVRHVNGEYKCRDSKLIPLLEEVKRLATYFEDFLLYHVLRDRNERADTAVNAMMDGYIRMATVRDGVR